MSRRSIPANAGEPLARHPGWPPDTVYPRERGGTWHRRPHLPSRRGLSPRTRGNRPLCPACPDAPGSIPANAGEPECGEIDKHFGGVYPRERGGTSRL